MSLFPVKFKVIRNLALIEVFGLLGSLWLKKKIKYIYLFIYLFTANFWCFQKSKAVKTEMVKWSLNDEFE